MTAPEKFILNMIKLAILTPVFIFAARVGELWVVIPLLLIGILYPIMTKPFQLNISAKYIPKAIKKWQAQQTAELDENDN